MKSPLAAVTIFQEITDLCHLSCSTTRVPWNSVILSRNETQLCQTCAQRMFQYMLHLVFGKTTTQRYIYRERYIGINCTTASASTCLCSTILYCLQQTLLQICMSSAIFKLYFYGKCRLALNKIGKQCLMIPGTYCLNNITYNSKERICHLFIWGGITNTFYGEIWFPSQSKNCPIKSKSSPKQSLQF